MSGGRRLTGEERRLWGRVAATIKPITPKRADDAADFSAAIDMPPLPVRGKAAKPQAPAAAPPPTARPIRPATLARATLDSHWDRRLRRGLVHPDLTVDLHGHTLASAHALLDAMIERAWARGARVVLVIAGRVRPGADRVPTQHGEARPRGAIRAALPDWLAHGPHADRIAATRPAHVSHGGGGAVYVVLRRG
ncbi:MAG: hypothetical protein RLZZ58_1917 [Pseudomonadota bacterium]|jgi:DNA-nicking Smr family endonuclease